MRVNMHTHSVYCDGKDRPEEMIQTALEKGFTILGFSGHGFSPYDTASMSAEHTRSYIDEINALKQKYQDRITIFLGIEQDSTCRIPNKEVREEWFRALNKIPDEYAVTTQIIQSSKDLLSLTLGGDEEAVARALDLSHIHVTSNRSYNNFLIHN